MLCDGVESRINLWLVKENISQQHVALDYYKVGALASRGGSLPFDRGPEFSCDVTDRLHARWVFKRALLKQETKLHCYVCTEKMAEPKLQLNVVRKHTSEF